MSELDDLYSKAKQAELRAERLKHFLNNGFKEGAYEFKPDAKEKIKIEKEIKEQEKEVKKFKPAVKA